MKIAATLLFSLFCAAAAPPSEIDALVDQARALPGEFAADALIRLAGADKLAESRRIDLLEQAYQRAGDAQQPYKRHAAVNPPGYPMGFINRAYDQELDGLSLRLRAIEAMLPLDGRKARRMFLDIGTLRLPQATCEDYLVYEPSRFYAVLGRVAAETFSPEETLRNEPFRLLARFTGTISSAVEVAPAARAIATARVQDGEFQALVTAFAGALGAVSGDDRSFTASSQAGGQIQALVEECRRRKLSPLPLIEGFRLYLVDNLSGKRCADGELAATAGQSFGMAASPASQPIGDLVTYFNNAIQVPPIQMIQPDEVAPASVEGKVKLAPFCQDSDCQDIGAQYRALVFNSDNLPHPPAYRDSDEFRVKLRDFLSAMASWKDVNGVAAADLYRAKAGVFSDLFNLVPSGPLQDAVADAMLDYLNQNRLQAEDAIQWFLPISSLIGRAGMATSLKSLAEKLRASHDPIVAFYARLELAAPRPADRIMPLL